MVPPLEIFRVEADGALIWCECADSLEIAVRRIEAGSTVWLLSLIACGNVHFPQLEFLYFA